MGKRKGPRPAARARGEEAPGQARTTARARWVVAGAITCVVAGLAIAWVVWPRQPRRPNLLLVTIDTLRADHVGAYGYAAAATQALDALAARGTRFVNAQTAAPLTGPSHATILTGHYPPVHGVRSNVTFTLGPRYPTLATLLKERGYVTGAFVGAYPVAAAFGFSQGFDEFNEGFHESTAGDPGAERPGNEVADAALAWLGRRDGARPFFAWLHFYDPHAPYAPPPQYRERYADRPYDGEIAFTDAQLARVLDWLRASGLDSNTVVVVMADHGEGLGEHHEQTHAVLVYESTMRVPFVVAGPGVAPGNVVPARVGTIDVLPTVMGLLGFDDVARNAVGRDLRPTLSRGAVSGGGLYGESLFGRLNCRWATLRVWIRGDWKLIRGTEDELYNLADDPGELQNRAAIEVDRVRQMSEELRRAVSAMAPGGDRARANAVTPEQEERLRSLGYAAGSPGAGELDDPTLPDPRAYVVHYDRLQSASQARGPAMQRALATVDEITRIDPDNPFAFSVLATMTYKHGGLGPAARAFARTLELDPDRPGMRLNYGKLLRELERLPESERELRIAVEQSGPDDARVRISLADTLVAAGKIEEAEKILREVVAREPKSPEAMGALGRLLLAQGKPADAVASFEQSTATPEPEPWIELADAYLRIGNAGKAISAGNEALKRSPGHPWAMAVTGRALIMDGQRPQGLDLLKRALATRPRRPAAWLSLADGFKAAGDPQTAAACRREAKAIAES